MLPETVQRQGRRGDDTDAEVLIARSQPGDQSTAHCRSGGSVAAGEGVHGSAVVELVALQPSSVEWRQEERRRQSGDSEHDTDSTDSEDSEDSGEADEWLCRICAAPHEAARPLVSPCGCRGTVSGVHEDCLQRWIETRPPGAAMKCEVCQEEYRVTFLQQFRCDCEHVCSCAACGQLAEMCMLGMTMACMVSVAFLLKPQLAKTTTMDRLFLGITYALTMLFSGVVLVKVFRRWLAAASARTLVANERLPPGERASRPLLRPSAPRATDRPPTDDSSTHQQALGFIANMV